MEQAVERFQQTGDASHIIRKLGVIRQGFPVFKCVNFASNSLVALRVVELDNLERDELDHIEEEIKLMKDCQCEQILSYQNTYVVKQQLWITMELLPCSVADILKVTMINEEAIRYVLHEVAVGLEYLHRHNVVHRDIKASNIFATDDGRIKISGFDVAAQLADKEGRRDTLCGSPVAMAPEVIQGSGHSFAADIWSYGILILELAYGEAPNLHVSAAQAMELTISAEPPTLEGPFSKDLTDLVDECLIQEPEYRITSTELVKHPLFLDEIQQLPFMIFIGDYLKETQSETKAELTLSEVCPRKQQIENPFESFSWSFDEGHSGQSGHMKHKRKHSTHKGERRGHRKTKSLTVNTRFDSDGLARENSSSMTYPAKSERRHSEKNHSPDSLEQSKKKRHHRSSPDMKNATDLRDIISFDSNESVSFVSPTKSVLSPPGSVTSGELTAVPWSEERINDVILSRATSDHQAREPQELSFKLGDIIKIDRSKTYEDGRFYYGEFDGRQGYVPVLAVQNKVVQRTSYGTKEKVVTPIGSDKSGTHRKNSLSRMVRNLMKMKTFNS